MDNNDEEFEFEYTSSSEEEQSILEVLNKATDDSDHASIIRDTEEINAPPTQGDAARRIQRAYRRHYEQQRREFNSRSILRQIREPNKVKEVSYKLSTLWSLRNSMAPTIKNVILLLLTIHPSVKPRRLITNNDIQDLEQENTNINQLIRDAFRDNNNNPVHVNIRENIGNYREHTENNTRAVRRQQNRIRELISARNNNVRRIIWRLLRGFYTDALNINAPSPYMHYEVGNDELGNRIEVQCPTRQSPSGNTVLRDNPLNGARETYRRIFTPDTMIEILSPYYSPMDVNAYMRSIGQLGSSIARYTAMLGLNFLNLNHVVFMMTGMTLCTLLSTPLGIIWNAEAQPTLANVLPNRIHELISMSQDQPEPEPEPDDPNNMNRP